jgi:phosphomethylpyrimidine synthase
LVRETLKRLKERPRLGGIVSRGGGFLAEWMLFHRKENPLFEHYDELLKLASRYEVVLSLGDALRPGAIADASDPAQIQELIILGELAERAWEAGVGVLIEGPGHMPLHQIRANVLLEKKLCREAPFYVLGPLTTDIAPGYDHITTAIGGAVAALAGADFLCYVTPAEHLKLPNLKEVKEGVMAARIAAHSADLAKGIKSALAQDEQMSKKRRALDWEGQKQFALDPEKLEEIKKENLAEQPYCTMCGEFCTMQGRFEKYLERI